MGYGSQVTQPQASRAWTVLSTASMPAALQWFAQYQPFTPFVETIRGLLLGTPLGWNPLLAVGWCILLTIIGYVWSMAIYERKSVR